MYWLSPSVTRYIIILLTVGAGWHQISAAVSSNIVVSMLLARLVRLRISSSLFSLSSLSSLLFIIVVARLK